MVVCVCVCIWGDKRKHKINKNKGSLVYLLILPQVFQAKTILVVKFGCPRSIAR